jgi:hypothetical protein
MIWTWFLHGIWFPPCLLLSILKAVRIRCCILIFLSHFFLYHFLSSYIYIYIDRQTDTHTQNDKKVMIWSMDQKKSWFLGIFELRNNHLKVRIQLFSYLSGLHVLYTLQLKLKKKIDYKKIPGNRKLFNIIIKSKWVNLEIS